MGAEVAGLFAVGLGAVLREAVSCTGWKPAGSPCQRAVWSLALGFGGVRILRVPTDFIAIINGNGVSAPPDFSAAGAPIEFEFIRIISSPAGNVAVPGPAGSITGRLPSIPESRSTAEHKRGGGLGLFVGIGGFADLQCLAGCYD